MTKSDDNRPDEVVLITGAAARIGAAVAKTLHHAGMRVAVHYRRSSADAAALVAQLNNVRPHSAATFQADLLDVSALPNLVDNVIREFGHLHALVNNASSFFPTPIGEINESQWSDLMGTNLKAPLFLSQAAVPELRRTHGCIVNIGDIHGIRPMKNHPVYSAAKAGLLMLTQSLARELGPDVRVNAVAPGAIVWPTEPLEDDTKKKILDATALKRLGDPSDIATAVRYLVQDAHYVTGVVLPVDGGRSLSQ